MQVEPKLARQLALKSGKMCDRVTVPLGPSVNNLFLSRGKFRVKSPQYRKWQAEVLPAFAFLKSPAKYPCRFRCIVGGKVHHARDLDNCLKVLLDAAKLALVIKDDSVKHVHAVDVCFEPGEGEAAATVWFEAINEE